MIMAESEIKAGSESDVISPSEQGLDFDEETLKGNITVYYQRTEGQKQHFWRKIKVNKIKQQNETISMQPF